MDLCDILHKIKEVKIQILKSPNSLKIGYNQCFYVILTFQNRLIIRRFNHTSQTEYIREDEGLFDTSGGGREFYTLCTMLLREWE